MSFPQKFLEDIWYDEQPSSTKRFVSLLLQPLSYVYALGAATARSNAKKEKLSCPVISVGNLTVGGTGKTIFVAEINKILQEMNLKGVILTRGYGKQSYEDCVLGKENHGLTPDITGDEAFCLWEECNETPILIGANRKQNFKNYAEGKEINYALLDDGFQHHSIPKDINICLIDAKRQLGNNFPLPAGPLREPAFALNNADLIIITRCDEDIDLSEIQKYCVGKEIIKTRFGFESLENSVTKETTPVEELKGKEVILVSGLGNNRQFRRMVEEKGLVTERHFEFPDHYNYTKKDFERIRQFAQDRGIATILTTRKDAVKLKSFVNDDIPKLFICNLSVNYLDEGKTTINHYIKKLFNR